MFVEHEEGGGEVVGDDGACAAFEFGDGVERVGGLFGAVHAAEDAGFDEAMCWDVRGEFAGAAGVVEGDLVAAFVEGDLGEDRVRVGDGVVEVDGGECGDFGLGVVALGVEDAGEVPGVFGVGGFELLGFSEVEDGGVGPVGVEGVHGGGEADFGVLVGEGDGAFGGVVGGGGVARGEAGVGEEEEGGGLLREAFDGGSEGFGGLFGLARGEEAAGAVEL